ncbi:MAG TPA: NFACT RNA binding domain-containing protein [Chitinispirillaceae bacterium]|nr:NFACT RNA binding domain-containing protein [Chitinispirillaceae bacterium]
MSLKHYFILTSKECSVKAFAFKCGVCKEMDELIDRFYSQINNSINKVSKKLRKQEQELIEAQKHLWYKQVADTLLASKDINTRGLSQIKIINIHTREEETVSVNPRFDAPANARLYYKKAKKGARSEEINRKKVAATNEYLTRLNDFCQKLEKINKDKIDKNMLMEMETELKSLIPDNKSPLSDKKGRASNNTPPFRHFYTNGWDIYVGKSDSQNDELSVRFAASSDIWLHVVAHPGSHVLIRKPKGSPSVPENVLKTAAQIAVWFSKAKHTSFAEVHYTEARFVRKRKHAPAGEVIAERCKSIRVSPRSPQDIFKKPFME